MTGRSGILDIMMFGQVVIKLVLLRTQIPLARGAMAHATEGISTVEQCNMLQLKNGENPFQRNTLGLTTSWMVQPFLVHIEKRST